MPITSLRSCFCDEKRQRLLPDLKAEIREKCQTHAGLWLDKFLIENTTQHKAEDKTAYRTSLVNEVARLPLPSLYTQFYRRWQSTLTHDGAQTRHAEVKSRMVVGLGTESVLETSIALHHTYGVPYIPGSALKGLAASYLRQRIAEKVHEPKSQAAKELETVRHILFGDTDEAGYIIFLDAFYIPGTGYNGQALYPDIITVHHQGYYQGNAAAAPSDKESPIPIPFLSATGTYLIALAAPELTHSQPWINLTFDILKRALASMGIGAKTSSGYGRMQLELPEDQPEVQPHEVAAAPIDEEARKIESYVKEVNALPDHSSIFGQMQPHYQRWQAVKTHPRSQELATAIIEKIKRARLEKKANDKKWYIGLLDVIEKRDE